MTWLRECAESHSMNAQLSLERQFRRHGRHIARHPVQTLLLACLIITSLFYPAMGIYLWSSKGGPGVTRGDSRSVWRSLSTPLLDSFASSGRKHHNSLRDLRMIWDDAPDLRAIDARDADAYLGSITQWHLHGGQDAGLAPDSPPQCRSVRVEHVFITTDDVILGLGPRFGSLHGPILRSAMTLQRSIEAAIGSDEGRQLGVPDCLREAKTGQCLVLSPLSYWNRDKDRLSNDSSPTHTILNSKMNLTEQGIPLSLSTTLAGRSHLFRQLPRADHLALTFFLEDPQGCARGAERIRENHSHKAWSAMLRNITGRQVGLLGSDWQDPKELLLQFVPRHPEESFPTQKVLLAVGYIAMIVWLTRSLFSIRNVHSPFGLAFTACIELVISMTLAISICALSGVRLTLIPWEILPFVIVVIGSENMFALTNAIISTPISLTVSSRLATGFEKVGVPIAVTVLSDVFLMGLVAVLVDVRAVREFCVFAVFALIVDFFMQMTFYATVLSIDMQRLELAELLSQDNRESSAANLIADDESAQSESASVADEVGPHRDAHPTSRGALFIKMSCRAAWRARTARTASLSLLLAFLAGIYLYHGSGYTSSLSYPFSVQENERAAWSSTSDAALPTELIAGEGHAFNPYSHLGGTDGQHPQQQPAPWWHSSPSASLWQSLNPTDSSSIYVKVEPWTVVSLPSANRQNVGKRNFASWAIFRPRVRAFIWFFKLTILPIAGTMALLWVLLLYLLKDTELLDAQQSKLDAQDDDEAEHASASRRSEAENSVQLDVMLNLCGEGHASDVALLAQSGTLLVSFAIDNTLQVSRQSKRAASKLLSASLTNVLRPFSTPCALAADASSDLIALGHANGALSLFSLSTLQLIATSLSTSNNDVRPTTPIAHLQISDHGSSASPTHSTTLLSFHRDGSIWRWDRFSLSPSQIAESKGEVVWNVFEASRGAVTVKDAIVASSSDGTFVLYQVLHGAPYVRLSMSARSSGGTVKSAALLDFANPESNAAQHIAIGTVTGKVAVYEMGTSRHVTQIDLFGGPINSLRSLSLQARSAEGQDQEGAVIIVAISPAIASVLSFSYERSGLTVAQSREGPPMTGATTSMDNQFGSQEGVSGSHLKTPTLRPTSNGTSKHGRHPSFTKQANGTQATEIVGASERPKSFSEGWDSSTHHGTDPGAPSSSKTSDFTLSLVADLGCRRGGADVVLSREGASLVGLRRRAVEWPSLMFALAPTSSRWEVFELNLNAPLLATSLTSQKILNDRDCEQWLKRAPLLLEERASQQGDVESATSLGRVTLRASNDPFTGARFSPMPLSFTRLSRVQAFYKHDGHPSSGSRLSLALMFGNVVGVAHVCLDKNSRQVNRPGGNSTTTNLLIRKHL